MPMQNKTSVCRACKSVAGSQVVEVEATAPTQTSEPPAGRLLAVLRSGASKETEQRDTIRAQPESKVRAFDEYAAYDAEDPFFEDVEGNRYKEVEIYALLIIMLVVPVLLYIVKCYPAR